MIDYTYIRVTKDMARNIRSMGKKGETYVDILKRVLKI